MVIVFTVLTHLVLFAAALGMLWLIAAVISGVFFGQTDFDGEAFMRCLAAACGLLLYLGSKAVGLSMPELMFKALSTSFPVAVGIVGVLFPASVGFLVSWYVVRQFENSDVRQNAVAIRILTIVVVFVFFLYSDSYVASFGTELGSAFLHLLPNLSFVLSVLLYAVFKFHPMSPERKDQSAVNSRKRS
ncbi:hypothetical protein [Bradyrhizobium sp.]